MSRRFLAWVGVIAVVAVAVGVFSRLVPGGGTTLETPWGEPDIQGIWSDQIPHTHRKTRPIRRQRVLDGRGSGRIGSAASGRAEIR